MKRMLAALVGFCASMAWASPPDVDNPMMKEGLALSRIALSPINIIGHAYAQVEHYGGVGVVFSPLLIAGAVPGGAMATCCDIFTGLGEMLAFEQFTSVSYPWQSFDYDTSDRWMDVALIVMGAAGEAAEKVGEVAKEIDSVKHRKDAANTQGGNGTALQSSDGNPGGNSGSSASGYGSISGPTTLKRGSTATYKLHVGGKLVNAEWSQGGTSISVYGSGDHGRVMAGNPPIKSGRYQTSIRAKYNGKTYRKTIYIQK